MLTLAFQSFYVATGFFLICSHWVKPQEVCRSLTQFLLNQKYGCITRCFTPLFSRMWSAATRMLATETAAVPLPPPCNQVIWLHKVSKQCGWYSLSGQSGWPKLHLQEYATMCHFPGGTSYHFCFKQANGVELHMVAVQPECTHV